jgi:hypothetical protein
MDLLATLRSKIEVLPRGDHLIGLHAVLLHIETAFRHLGRGQETDDDTAFTDVIFRTNQAFEGGIKEAYRVLTGKDPQRLTPFEIEAHLDSAKVFRQRVLAQFTAYRREWRNPSTHDYKLDFDESEAFLAIITVAAFTHLLLNQIAERLAEEAARDRVEIMQQSRPAIEVVAPEGDAIDQLVPAFLEFARLNRTQDPSAMFESEAQFVGAIAGFVKAVMPGVEVQAEVNMRVSTMNLQADLIVTVQGQPVIVELKRARLTDATSQRALMQLTTYMRVTGANQGILFNIPREDASIVARYFEHSNLGKIAIIGPSPPAPP